MRSLSEFVFDCHQCQHEIHSSDTLGKCPNCKVEFELYWKPTDRSVTPKNVRTIVTARMQGESFIVPLYRDIVRAFGGLKVEDKLAVETDGQKIWIVKV